MDRVTTDNKTKGHKLKGILEDIYSMTLKIDNYNLLSCHPLQPLVSVRVKSSSCLHIELGIAGRFSFLFLLLCCWKAGFCSRIGKSWLDVSALARSRKVVAVNELWSLLHQPGTDGRDWRGLEVA